MDWTWISIIDHIGVFVSALAGALVAARKEMDVTAFLVLGSVAGIGGGTTRDIILDLPVFWVLDPSYLIICMLAASLAYFWARQPMGGLRAKGILWLDAAALGVFASSGALKAIDNDHFMIIAILMGIITASAGGLIRDIIAQETPFVLRGEIYAIAAAIGATTCVLLNYLEVPRGLSLWTGAGVGFFVRMLAIYFQIRLHAGKRLLDNE